MKWIRVEDELPEENTRVWYYFEVTGVSAGFMTKEEHGIVFQGGGGFLTNDVTHWMPLTGAKPSPPMNKDL